MSIFKLPQPEDDDPPTTAHAQGFIAGMDRRARADNPYSNPILAAKWEAGRQRMNPEGKRL